MSKRVAGFAASEKGAFVRQVGVEMGRQLRTERRRHAWHLVALWVAVVITFIVAVL